MLPDRSLNRF